VRYLWIVQRSVWRGAAACDRMSDGMLVCVGLEVCPTGCQRLVVVWISKGESIHSSDVMVGALRLPLRMRRAWVSLRGGSAMAVPVIAEAKLVTPHTGSRAHARGIA
jgi:hypothetical protein